MLIQIYIPIILAILLSDAFLCRKMVRRKRDKGKLPWVRIAIVTVPSVVMLAYTVWLLAQRSFAPDNVGVLNVYLFLLAVVVIPKFVYVVCSATGFVVSRIVRKTIRKGVSRPAHNYGNLLGLLLVGLIWFVAIYGVTLGFSKVTVRHEVYTSSDLPAAFDGYKIVHFSDAHVGTYGTAKQHILSEFIDSINAQNADAIMFTGDLQNREPQEIYPHLDLLSSLKARDGVFSVLGNHDYANYIKADATTKVANERETVRLERQMGWMLLRNDHETIHRGNDSIVVAGMENDGDGIRFPQLGDIDRSLNSVSDKAWVLMLQHDPSCWKRKILPMSNARLTLSGHTHAMQFALFGWSPARFVYDEWGGMFHEGNRAINVSTGMGGFIPFRFGVPGEIVVIELRKK